MRKQQWNDFLFPLAKWAGGIYLGQQFRKDTLQGADLAYVKQNLSLVLTTFGLEKHFKFFKEIH
jgi:hypothetical protein